MYSIIEQLEFEGEFSQFVEFLRTEAVLSKNRAESLKEAAWISKSIDGRLPSLFGRLPRQLQALYQYLII